MVWFWYWIWKGLHLAKPQKHIKLWKGYRSNTQHQNTAHLYMLSALWHIHVRIEKDLPTAPQSWKHSFLSRNDLACWSIKIALHWSPKHPSNSDWPIWLPYREAWLIPPQNMFPLLHSPVSMASHPSICHWSWLCQACMQLLGHGNPRHRVLMIFIHHAP